MSERYPFTVTFDGHPTPARLSDENDPVPGLYLDRPPGEGEVLVGIGCAEGLIRELLADRDLLRVRVRDLERSEGQLMDERDALHNSGDVIADQLGVEEEWTNATDRGACAVEAAADLEAERDRLRTLVSRQRKWITRHRLSVGGESRPDEPPYCICCGRYEDHACHPHCETAVLLADADGQSAADWLEAQAEPWKALAARQRYWIEIHGCYDCAEERDALRADVVGNAALAWLADREAKARSGERAQCAALVRAEGCSCLRSIDRYGGAYGDESREEIKNGRHFNEDCPEALAARIEAGEFP